MTKIDYASIAKKYGGTQGQIDYSSIANKYGGMAQTNNPFPTSEPEPIKRNFFNKIAGFIGGEKISQGIGQGLNQGVATKQIAQTQTVETQQAKQLTDAIKKNRSVGKDTSRLEQALKALTGNSVGYQAENLLNPANLTTKEVVGDALQMATTAVGLKVPNPTGSLLKTIPTKIIEGAGLGYGFDVSQNLKENKSGGDIYKPGIGTVFGGALPIATDLIIKPVAKIVGSLFKGLGSGLSGVGTNTIDELIKNPKTANKLDKILAKKGNAVVVEKNARDIVEGVASIKSEARTAFGKGLEQLSKEDIKPDTFKSVVQGFLDKIGSTRWNGKGAIPTRTLSNVEFSDPKNLKKASELIDKLSKTELDGKSLRKLVDDIENAVYGTATSDERLSFNVFVKDMASTVKSAITTSTSKLDKINAAYTTDLQLAEAVEKIFGKVKFKNLSEVNAVSQKLEGLFSQKGLSSDIVDKFLQRAGIGSGLKTSEAVRQISNIGTKANTKGLSFGEILQQVTSSIITPNIIKKAAIATGWTEQTIGPVLKKLTPTARVEFLNLISKVK
jgi:hypothetical protein